MVLSDYPTNMQQSTGIHELQYLEYWLISALVVVPGMFETNSKFQILMANEFDVPGIQ